MSKEHRAVILCAGAGLRLAELTKGKPKSFLQVGEQTLIGRQIAAVREAGIDDITLVVGYRDQLFRETFSDCSFVMNREFRTTNTAHSLALALSHKESKSVFVLNADVFFDYSLISGMMANSAPTVAALDRKRNGEEEIKVRLMDGNVVAIGKYINEQVSSGEAFGVYKLSPVFARYLRRELTLMNNPLFFYERGIDTLLRGGHIMGVHDIGGDMAMEIDTPEDYFELLNLLGLEG